MQAPKRVIGGIAVTPAQGTLVQKLGTFHPYSGTTGYEGIRANLGIALDIDSPAGEVVGCLDLADAMYAARGQKSLRAMFAASAS